METQKLVAQWADRSARLQPEIDGRWLVETACECSQPMKTWRQCLFQQKQDGLTITDSQCILQGMLLHP